MAIIDLILRTRSGIISRNQIDYVITMKGGNEDEFSEGKPESV